MHEHTVRANVASGTVEGFTRDGVNRWRAIPYARPPVGRLRLRAPQPVEPWPGVRYCHGFANCAPQQRKYTILAPGKYQPMSEDCLTLNVATPASPADGPLPVKVFIHGGGYMLGSSATPIYDGAALAKKGCVYVSVNYRLGALGCLELSLLSTRDVTIDDNLYLRDLVMALRWVRDNIAVFGGDPENVTIFGESAGAHAVATLLAVPAAKGLFAQAISESPASGMVRPLDVAGEYAAKFAAQLGASKEDGTENALPPPTRTTHIPTHASSSAATSHSGRRYGRSPRRTASTPQPTCTATTTRRARCDGRAWARRTRPSCSRCSTSTAASSAGCSPPPPTGARPCGSATTCRRAGVRSAAPACRAWTGPPTPAPRAVMVLDRRPHVEYDPHADRRQAWEGFSLAAP